MNAYIAELADILIVEGKYDPQQIVASGDSLTITYADGVVNRITASEGKVTLNTKPTNSDVIDFEQYHDYTGTDIGTVAGWIIEDDQTRDD